MARREGCSSRPWRASWPPWAMAAPAGAAIVGQGGVRMGADVLWSGGRPRPGPDRRRSWTRASPGSTARSPSASSRRATRSRSGAFDPLEQPRGRVHGVRHPHPARGPDGRARPRPGAPGPAGARRLPHARPVRGGGRLDHGPGHPDRQPLQLLPDPSVRRHGRAARAVNAGDRCGGALGQLRRQLRASGTGAERWGPRAPSSRSHRPLGRRCCSAWRGLARRAEAARGGAPRPVGRLGRGAAQRPRRPDPCERRPRSPPAPDRGGWSCARRPAAGRAHASSPRRSASVPSPWPTGSIPTPGDAAGGPVRSAR